MYVCVLVWMYSVYLSMQESLKTPGAEVTGTCDWPTSHEGSGKQIQDLQKSGVCF